MAQFWQVGELEQRRQLLVAESERLRQQLAGDVADLRPTLAWVQRGFAVVQSLRSFWPVLAAAAGFFAARKSNWFRSVGKAWSAWRLGKKALEFWRRRRGAEKRDGG